MKKFSFLALAAAGLLFAACSSDKDVAETEAASILNGSGDGYVGISISIPSAAGNTTRANDDFVNGKSDEFEVKNARLFLFKGSDEASATFMKSYDLENGNTPINDGFAQDTEGEKNTPEKQTGVTFEGGTGITSTSVTVCKIDKPNLGTDKLFAYVVVNAQGDLGGEPAIGTPFSEFSQLEVKARDNGGTLDGTIGDNGLLMTNSPISDKGAGSAAPSEETLSTLVELNPINIKNTRQEAIDAPAGCVYVERAAAKVTVTDNIAAANKKIEMGSETNTLSYSIVGWQIINTEKKFYNTRQIESAWDPLTSQYKAASNTKYRFISKYDFAPTIPSPSVGHTTGFRTYFAKDLQYDVDAELDHTVAGETGRTWLGLTARSFVPENTFDVNHQQRKNTTQVTLKVQFNDGNDFYTISNDAKYYLPANIEATIAAKVGIMYKFDKFLNDYVEFQEAALNNTPSPEKYYKVSVVATASITDDSKAADKVEYTVSYTPTITESTTIDGTYTASTVAPAALNADLSAAWNVVKAEAEAYLTVSLYKGGMSYYNIRIKHFGEEETPWSASRGVQPGETIEQIYGAESTRTADYLGRYGVVRDNWYNLSIDGISKLGTAEPKPVNGDPTPDDEIVEEYYVAAHVHILPWVLRTQSVQF